MELKPTSIDQWPWPVGQNYEPFYKPFYKYYNIIILIILLIVANLQGNISIRGQVRGSIYEGLDLAAAATVVDIGRHRPKLISATRPLSHTASQTCLLFRQARSITGHSGIFVGASLNSLSTRFVQVLLIKKRMKLI